MPYTCCVVGCSSNGKMVGRKFFRFPMLDNHSANSIARSQARQQAWLDALKRPNFFERYYKNAKVCDRHFVSGRSANLHDMKNVDWIPTLNLGHRAEEMDNRVVVVKVRSGETFTIVEVDDTSDKSRGEDQTANDNGIENQRDIRDSAVNATGTQTCNISITTDPAVSSIDMSCPLRTTRGTQTNIFDSDTVGTQTASKSFSTCSTQTVMTIIQK